MFALPRFYPILDTGVAERHSIPLIHAAEQILSAGARILQYRHKGFFTRANFEHAERLAQMCSQAGAIFVINDRADLAAILGAALHLGQDDLLPSLARRVTAGIIGYSTHNEMQLREAHQEPADYFALGPIFATGSKQNPDPVVGLEGLRRLRPLSKKPLVAIGGITLTNANQVFDAGADSVAVIGDLFADGQLKKRTAQWLVATSPIPKLNPGRCKNI